MTGRVSVPANLSRPSLLSDGYHMLSWDKSGEWRDELLPYLVMWSITDVPLTSRPLQTLSGAQEQFYLDKPECIGKTIMCSFSFRIGTPHLLRLHSIHELIRWAIKRNLECDSFKYYPRMRLVLRTPLTKEPRKDIQDYSIQIFLNCLYGEAWVLFPYLSDDAAIAQLCRPLYDEGIGKTRKFLLPTFELKGKDSNTSHPTRKDCQPLHTEESYLLAYKVILGKIITQYASLNVAFFFKNII
jgi:hypothetical protein